MAQKGAIRHPPEAYVQIAGQHIKLPESRLLKLGPLSIDFGDGGVLGFEAHCCKGDLADCIKQTGACPADRPIIVFK